MGVMMGASIACFIRQPVTGRIQRFNVPLDHLKHRQSVLLPLFIARAFRFEGYKLGHCNSFVAIVLDKTQSVLVHVLIRFHLRYRC